MLQETCWTLIRAAASGDRRARSTFARSYLSVVRAYLAARWRGSPLMEEIDDAIQQVFIECLQDGGVLERADPAYPNGFQALLRGAVRNVAMVLERKRARRLKRVPAELIEPELVPADDTSLSEVFDRAFARRLMQEAGDRQLANARASGEAALRRVELIRLRFQDDLPIRDIAAKLAMDPAFAHHQFAQARKEFHQALRETVLFYDPGVNQVDRECRRLLELLA
jgi:RNA polymerase sigma-70 factor (ECF subfamily)